MRCYHRATGTPIDLERSPLGSAEFFAECARIAALTTAVGAPKPGTLGLLIAQYRKHAAFVDLAPRTRDDYQRIFDYLKPISGYRACQIQPAAGGADTRQGCRKARTPFRKLCEGGAFDHFRLGN